MKIILKMLLLTLIVVIASGTASAHVPTFSDEHGGLESAVKVENPTKSWVLYGELHDTEDTRYYKLELKKGERLRLVLFSPDQDLILSAVVMGPGIASEGEVPEFVETVNGSGVQVVAGEKPESASYEPFTPGSYYYFVDYDEKINVSGTYYVAVYSTGGEGNFGLAVGYKETFSLTEWIRVPLDAVRIHMWEGQNLAVVISPLILTIIVGLVVLTKIKPRGIQLPLDQRWRAFGSLAALFYIGTGIIMLHQMFRAMTIGPAGGAAVVTLIFAGIPIILGYIILSISLNLKVSLTMRKRFRLIILAIIGIFTWSGLIFGPVILIITAFLPAGQIKTDSNAYNKISSDNRTKKNND